MGEGHVFVAPRLVLDYRLFPGGAFDEFDQSPYGYGTVVAQVDALAGDVRGLHRGQKSRANVADMRKIAENRAVAVERQRASFQDGAREDRQREFRPQSRAVDVEKSKASERYVKEFMVRKPQ